MNFLSQNWWWILLLIGVLLLFSRRGHHGLGGFGHRDHRYPTSPGEYRDHREHPEHSAGPTVATDPVTHNDVATTQAVTSVYRGRIYYFESADSRQRFETSPEQYARQGLSHPAASEDRVAERPRRRGGC
ncbi:MAG TPA: YHS domain-containing protein [Steroidobacteraceae bacterium]|nr:YHS domain-containing protein [Steroidobacteraceae bacterium]